VVRWYAVWRVPGALYPVVGLHAGDISAWSRIVGAIPGGRYRSGRDRLRRYGTEEQAIDGFYAEAPGHQVELPAVYYR
jgi:hypothetical protein